MSAAFRLHILLLASLWSLLVVVVRQAFDHPETHWLHDRPDYFVGLLYAMRLDQTDAPWMFDLRAVAEREYNFRRITGIRK